jgi:hypothetical protein
MYSIREAGDPVKNELIPWIPLTLSGILRKQPSHIVFIYTYSLYIHIHKYIFSQMELPCRGCRSTCQIFGAVNGTFSDGSGSENYPADANCQWVIAPINATRITITFSQIATESCCDPIRVFQCPDTECQGLQRLKVGEFAGIYTTPQVAVSNTGFMLVEFTSSNDVAYDGFTARWTSNAPVPSDPQVLA